MSDLDIEALLNGYSPHAKIARLLFISSHSPPLKEEALRLSLVEVKKTLSASLFRTITQDLGLGDDPENLKWIDKTEKTCVTTFERLERELNLAKTTSIKEEIRMGEKDLGDFFFSRGDYAAAKKHYQKTWEFCTNSQQRIQSCLSIIKVAARIGNSILLQTQISKAEAENSSSAPIKSQLHAAAGLAHLLSSNYKAAARSFLLCSPDIEDTFSEVILPRDIAIYASLCALASLDRADLKRLLFSNETFKPFLELVPQIRELVNDFYNSKYTRMLNTLSSIRSSLEIDLYLFYHVESLYSSIRSRGIIQYFSPFVSVDLNHMSGAFNTSIPDLEEELKVLIAEGKIAARIDSHNKVLYARQTNQRSETFSNAVSFGEEWQHMTESTLLHINLVQKGINVAEE